jgi:hypothetical protein
MSKTMAIFNYVAGALAEGRRRQPPTRLEHPPEDGVGEEEEEGPPRHLPFRYRYLSFSQGSGSMTFWCGSGSTDGSMPLTNGTGFGSGSCYFRHWILRRQQKFLKKVFCLLLFKGTFTSFFKDDQSKINHKLVGIKVFLVIFAWW